jgi:hypothetical protein
MRHYNPGGIYYSMFHFFMVKNKQALIGA